MDDTAQYWYRTPRSSRIQAAAAYREVALEALALSKRAYNVLRRSRQFPDVAALMLAGPYIEDLRNFGETSIREVDVALQPLFEQAGAQPTKPETLSDEFDSDPDAEFKSALRALADLGSFSEDPWFKLPLGQRVPLVDRFEYRPVQDLDLSKDAWRIIQTLPGIRDVGALLGVSANIRGHVHLGDTTLEEVHDKLVAFARDRVAWLEIRQRWIDTVEELRKRTDLPEMTLADLGWPASAIEMCSCDTVADLPGLSEEDAELLWDVLASRPQMQRALLVATESLLDLPPELDDDGLVEFWISRGFEVLPEGYRPNGPHSRAQAIEQIIRHLVEIRGDETDWSILQHRWALMGVEKYTLQQLGDAFGVTRERIRQREKRTLELLRAWLDARGVLEGMAQLHPEIERTLGRLERVLLEARTAAATEPQLMQQTQAVLVEESDELPPVVRLLAQLYDLGRISMGRKGLAPIWAGSDRALRSRVTKRVTQLHEQLTQTTSEALTEVALAVAVNETAAKEDRITVPEVREYVSLCTTIEQLPDGRYRGKYHFLGNRSHRMERILGEVGEPMHFLEIQRRMNQLAVQAGQREIMHQNLGNQLAADDRFVPLGRSGYWAMADWPDVETGTVLELMERCLMEHSRPMTPEEVYAWVSKHRPVSENSIVLYISSDDRFAKIDRERWGLAHWKEAKGARTWTRADVAEFVASVFAQHKAKRLPYEQVRSELMEEADVPERVAQGLLGTNPVIETELGPDGVRYADLQPDYKSRLKRERGGRPRSKRLKEFRDTAREILSDQPGLQMPLREFREIMVAEIGTPRPSVYSNVARIEELQTSPLPGEPGKLVRWVGAADRS